MTINTLNYELYALDYLEGTLSPALQAEMETFLRQHPDIALDFEAVATYRPLEALPAPAYPRHAELRKPITATWARYTHWIAPISISVLFMIAYPYWLHRTQRPGTTTTSTPQQATASAPSSGASGAVVLQEEEIPLTPPQAQSTQAVLPSGLSANAASAALTPSTPRVGAVLVEDDAFESVDLAREPRRYMGARSNALAWQAPQETVHANAFVRDAALPLPYAWEELDAHPAGLPMTLTPITATQRPLADLKTLAPATFAERRKWVLSVMPLGIGIDTRKIAAQDDVPTLDRHIPVDETGIVSLGMPQHTAIGIQYHWGRGWYAATGLSHTHRALAYIPMEGSDLNTLRLDVAYRTWSIPLSLGYRHALHARGALEWQIGGVLTAMGRSGYTPIMSGAASLELPRGYDVFNTPMLAGKLLVVADELRVVPAWEAQVAYVHELGQGHALSLSVGYGEQLNTVNQVRLWDYDFDAQYRSDMTAFDMRFSTLRIGVAYRHALGGR